jgi:hypothetical protein
MRDIAQGKDSASPQSVFEPQEYLTISSHQFVISIWKFKYSKKFDVYYLAGLYLDGFLKICTYLGYYKRYHDDGKSHCLIHDKAGIIQEVKAIRLKDEVFDPDQLLFEDLKFDYINPVGQIFPISVTAEELRETYLKNYHNVLNDNFLEHLTTHEKPLLKDSLNQTYLFFLNVIVKITSTHNTVLDYSSLTGSCIWKENIIQRNFAYVEDYSACHFSRFISNICSNDPLRIKAVRSAIGYLVNTYGNVANSRAVICYDEEITDLKNPQGGTGKGVLAQAIKEVRTVTKLDGKRLDPKDKFRWQAIEQSTQIVWVDDAPAKLGFDIFHSVITDGWNVEKKNKEVFYIRPQDSPKLLLTSNSIVTGNGNTNERRQFIIEFSPFYSTLQRNGIKEPVLHVHGCTFFDPDDWSTDEWNMFYSFMVDCCRLYHAEGLQFIQHAGFEKNRLLQSTSSDFDEWMEEKNFKVGQEYNRADEYREFIDSCGPFKDFPPRRFTSWLKEYANYKQYEFKSRKSNGQSYFSFSQCSSD